MSFQNGFNIYLDSRHSTTPSIPYDTKFLFTDSRLARLTNARITLNKFCIPNSVLPFDGYTKLFVTESPSTELTVTITNQNYTPAQFVSELQNKLNAVSTQTYTVTYSSSTLRVTISANTTPFKIKTGRGLVDTENIHKVSFAKYLGFYRDDAFELTKGAPGILNLAGSQYIDIRSNLPVNALSSGPAQNILARLYLDSSLGQYVIYDEKNGSVALNIASQGFSSLEVAIYDENGNLFRCKEHWSAILTVHY